MSPHTLLFILHNAQGVARWCWPWMFPMVARLQDTSQLSISAIQNAEGYYSPP